MRESAALTEPVPDTSFRQALANLASGVTVITAYAAAGPVGLAATRFVSVSRFPRYS
jgi:flavin reductase (DIM6/NTAB) family NADH-FMN oxidoreductase RutF